jgi:hypothetical protein
MAVEEVTEKAVVEVEAKSNTLSRRHSNFDIFFLILLDPLFFWLKILWGVGIGRHVRRWKYYSIPLIGRIRSLLQRPQGIHICKICHAYDFFLG